MFDSSAKGKAPTLISTTDNNNKQAEEARAELQAASVVAAEVSENPILKRVLSAFTSATKSNFGKKWKSVQTTWSALSSLVDMLATYLGEALEHSNLAKDFGNFLFSCFAESAECEKVSECIYEIIETTCGIRTSIKGYLNCHFVINCMSLANVAKNLSATAEDGKAEQRFIQFIKEVLMQQIFDSEDARLLVLDTLCLLCQDLSSQIDTTAVAAGANGQDDDSSAAGVNAKKRESYEALVIHCRKQYLDFKDCIENRRKKEEQEAEEELQKLESDKLSDAYSGS